MSWLDNGPLSQFGGGARSNPVLTGARAGAAFGPIGMGVGALAGWLYGRYSQQSGPIAGQQTANSMLGNDIQSTQDRIWGNTAPQTPQDDGTSMDPNATSMGPPMDEDGDGRITPGERRDANSGGYGGTPALYGVSNFMVGGSPVINGVRPAGGDMNGMAMYNPRLNGG